MSYGVLAEVRQTVFRPSAPFSIQILTFWPFKLNAWQFVSPPQMDLYAADDADLVGDSFIWSNIFVRASLSAKRHLRERFSPFTQIEKTLARFQVTSAYSWQTVKYFGSYAIISGEWSSKQNRNVEELLQHAHTNSKEDSDWNSLLFFLSNLHSVRFKHHYRFTCQSTSNTQR